ncbi:hypothetical protein [Mesoplasma florum]|uniref:hypothetical protein n=1 Tax=Mesoplasma florum TaxID=2151 RepID=UPI000BE42D0F|nr:hypothetical protein [Mesoplasma florum]ATI74189.1 hypothetical protein CQZ70_03010 [Mesoplasma florum]
MIKTKKKKNKMLIKFKKNKFWEIFKIFIAIILVLIFIAVLKILNQIINGTFEWLEIIKKFDNNINSNINEKWFLNGKFGINFFSGPLGIASLSQFKLMFIYNNERVFLLPIFIDMLVNWFLLISLIYLMVLCIFKIAKIYKLNIQISKVFNKIEIYKNNSIHNFKNYKTKKQENKVVKKKQKLEEKKAMVKKGELFKLQLAKEAAIRKAEEEGSVLTERKKAEDIKITNQKQPVKKTIETSKQTVKKSNKNLDSLSKEKEKYYANKISKLEKEIELEKISKFDEISRLKEEVIISQKEALKFVKLMESKYEKEIKSKNIENIKGGLNNKLSVIERSKIDGSLNINEERYELQKYSNKLRSIAIEKNFPKKLQEINLRDLTKKELIKYMTLVTKKINSESI